MLPCVSYCIMMFLPRSIVLIPKTGKAEICKAALRNIDSLVFVSSYQAVQTSKICLEGFQMSANK